MTPLQPIFIAGLSQGLETDKKPFLLTDQAFPFLENAYTFRERVKKREGIKLLGRLRRIMTAVAIGVLDGSGNLTIDLKVFLSLEANAEIEPGSISAIILGITFTDIDPTSPTTPPNGNIFGPAGVIRGLINYVTGVITFAVPVLAGNAVSLSFNYFPSLPTMGINTRELTTINTEQTIFYDTKYAYVFFLTGFQEFIPGTTWAGSNSDFFWSANYRGSTPGDRLYFVTNFVCDANDPIRYTDGATWNNFNPLVDAANNLYQARIIIPYYGRLLALNVFEGTTVGGYAGAVNIASRCRFSQIGNPIAVDAWRSDQFGKGGFIDAPTSEAIISAAFFKNTLIVYFERSTWQLRYVGEYGLPFIWERISSDFGSESTFSAILFDDGVLAVGDKGITACNSINIKRIDEKIPDIVFSMRNIGDGVFRVQGIRDFQKELVYWCYSDAEQGRTYPNRVLVYNYRNNTYSIFRDNLTCFGTYQSPTAVTWDSVSVLWDNMDVTWDDPDVQANFPLIVSGNQQGYIHEYGYSTENDVSLSITDIDLTLTPITLTVVSHNLEDGDIIFVQDLNFSVAPDIDLNDAIYRVSVIDDDTISISEWSFTAQVYGDVPAQTARTYLGGGQIKLFPQVYVQTKDFNPFQGQGKQMFLSYIDFLMDATPSSAISVQLFVNASPSVQGNLLIGNQEVESSIGVSSFITAATQALNCQITSPSHGLVTGTSILIDNVEGMTQLNGNIYEITVVDSNNFTLGASSISFSAYVTDTGIWQVIPNFYVPGSEYAWHRFYSTSHGQYIRIVMTYDDDLMNTLSTHQQAWVLDAITLWVREGGKIVF